jgi:hypothetical protein
MRTYIQFQCLSANHHCRFQFLNTVPYLPISNIQSLASGRALPSQLNQTNDLSRLGAARGEIALTTKSPDQLAVVLGVGGGLNGRNDLLDRLAVLDGGQSTVALARFTAVAVILGLDARLELVFLDVKVELRRMLACDTSCLSSNDGHWLRRV